MADDPTDVAPECEPPVAGSHGGGAAELARVGAIWEWLWRGRAMATARRAHAGLSPGAVEAAHKAQEALAKARQLWRPRRPSSEGTAHALICELCRQATYWSLVAQLRRVGAVAEASEQEAEDLRLLWAQARERGVLPEGKPNWQRSAAEAASGDGCDPVELLGAQRLAEFEQLPEAHAARLAAELWPGTRALVDSLGGGPSVAFVWRQRLLRWLLVVGIVTFAGAAFSSVRRVYRLRRDLAVGVAWRASSSNGMGCRSPQQMCTTSAGFFVHTKRQSKPWIVFDLGADKQVSAVHVTNRADCCQERSIPLSVEVRAEGGKWSQVAHRTKAFSGTWVADFETTTAREVRLRVQRTSYLHLARVRILP